MAISAKPYLFEQYRDLLQPMAAETKWPYAFGFFDNGARIPDIARLMYHALGAERKNLEIHFLQRLRRAF